MIDEALHDLIRRTAYHTVFVDGDKNVVVSKLLIQVPSTEQYHLETTSLFAVASVDGTVGAVESAMQQAVFGFGRQLSTLIVSSRKWLSPVYAFDAETGLPNAIEQRELSVDRARLTFPRRVQLESGAHGLAFQEYQS